MARIKAAHRLDGLRGGAPKAFLIPFCHAGQGAGSGGRAKAASPQRSNPPTSPTVASTLLLKAALISCGGKQPKVTATGESGMPDEIKELPWSVYDSKAWPDPKTQY